MRNSIKTNFVVRILISLALCMAFLAVPTVKAQALPFNAATNYPVGQAPISVAVGDLNMDGKLDVVTANYDTNNVSVLLGSGNGTFATAVNYQVGTWPTSVAVGDFNMDGKPDLAVTNRVDNNISILIGNGFGAFSTAVNYGVGSNPFYVTVSDFNMDGKLDLAVANWDTDDISNVSILMGVGDGTFAAVVNYSVGIHPSSVAIGDFNRDGTTDLAVANYTSCSVAILSGNGNGTFAAAVNYPVGINPWSVATGDFNMDGKPDLATANHTGSDITILLGDGDGTFAAAVSYTTGTNPRSVAVGDFNSDGKPDLTTANQGSNNISILQGNGDGTFAAAVNYTAGTWSLSVAIGDFNRDGATDLATANFNGNNVSILLNTPSSLSLSFRPAVNYPTGTEPFSVAVRDFNSDGKLDLSVANWGSNTISILIGSGTGTFNPATNYAVGTHPNSLAIGDFNRDGKPDLATANYDSNTISILIGSGTGTFNPAVNYTVGTNPRYAMTGDFNLDGKPDLAIANYSSNTVSILLGSGTGTFNPATNYAVGTHPNSLAIGDFNRDGKPDLATANSDSKDVSILIGSGTGAFSLIGSNPAGAWPISIVMGDFNLDGNPDLAVTDCSKDVVSILIGTGTGSFNAAVSYGVGRNPISMAIGDFNRDGATDLATANGSTGNDISILLGVGDGTFNMDVNYPAGSWPYSVAVGDFNSDGDVDLAVADFYSDNISILLNLHSPAPLSVSTNQATDITINSAMLNGNLSSLGIFDNATVSFQWGLSTGIYTDNTTPQLRTSMGMFSDNITGLQTRTIYYYRAQAKSNGNTVYGTELSFTTGAAPTVTTGLGIYASESWFYMSGSLTGFGTADTSVTPYIEYWGSANGTWTLSSMTSIGSFSTPTTLQNPPGTMPAGTYTFRAKAQGDQSGIWAYGDNATFIFQPSQPHTITTSTNTGTLTLQSNLGNITSLSAIGIQILPNLPPLLIFPHGLMYFEVSNIAPGSTVTFTITFPIALPANIQYWKYQPTRGWFQIPITSHNGNVITIQITDGGLGDADGLVNGIIVDPGGIAIPATPTPTPIPTPANPLIGANAPTSHGSSVAGTTITTQPVLLPNIQIQSASLSASKVSPGTPIKVTANIANRGTVNGSIRIKLYVNGEEDSSQGITVESGGNRPVYFTVSRSQPGTYDVYIGGTYAGSFTVDDVIDPNIILFISLSLIALSLMLAVIMVARRKLYY